MRIVSGLHKGRSIIAPQGLSTRPTGDRTREALFNVVAHATWAPPLAGARVIDLFAGSGALGLEAISRGAAFCLFVETDHAARGAIRTNIDAMGLFGQTKLHRRSAASLGDMPATAAPSFNLAFLDPPYNMELARPCLEGLINGCWLADNAITAIETAADETLTLPGWTLLDERVYGAAKVSFLKHG